MIKTTLIANLGSDAVINNVNGQTVINFSAAHSQNYKNREGVTVNKTIWVSCSWFTDRTGIVPFLKKGVSIYCEGEPSVDIYKNKEGQSIPQLRLRVNMVQLLGSSPKKDNPQPQQPASGLTASQEEFLAQDDSGLPF